ncbi:MAG TPA: SAM-dependent methyltransferase [Puia sp.]|nr:SAM-dependent methyltransferase [Puia sp.]
MKANKASRTAQYMALYRALETRRPPKNRLFSDPYAIHFLDKGFQLACRACSILPLESLFYRIIQRRMPGALASGLARTYYIDELLKRTIRAGARQVIILGAGFDTRALRLPILKNVPVIEIDHPDTARSKMNTLKKVLGGALPTHIRYLQTDFGRQGLAELFREQAIDLSIPTTFIWEGMTNYLQREAVGKVFALAGEFPAGSSIIFTYIDKKVLDQPSAFFGAERLLKDLDRIEEKWTCGFAPEELPEFLRPFHLQLVEDKGAEDYRENYIPERTRILKGYEFYRVAMAVRAMDPASK